MKHFIVFALVGAVLGAIVNGDRGFVAGLFIGPIVLLGVMYATGFAFSVRKRLENEKKG